MSLIGNQRYRFLTAAEAEPTGWLRRQLETVGCGLPGNLDLMWRDVRDSKWIGGDADGWERVPYWLDGFVPLAFLLKDEDKIARAKRYIHAILDKQEEDGWICPCTAEERAGYDMWALLLISKVLVGYAECCPEEAGRIESALLRAFRQADGHLREHPLFNWGKYRWFEGLIAVWWLYGRTHDAWLLSFADLLHAQGKDYRALIDAEFDAYKEPERKWQWDTHVVNLSMAIKADALWRLRETAVTEPLDAFSDHMYETLMQYHGMPVGQFTGDECLAGRAPIQGTELCGVVEDMYSDEWLLAITGNPIWGARLERLVFNALPATTTPDMWRHQYDQQTNQTVCAPITGAVPYGTNGQESGVFGLEPNYGCCTANLPQGWPKFVLAAFMANENAVFSAVPVPMKAHLRLSGVDVTVECDTAYPFEDTVTYKVTCAESVSFSLDIRVPDRVTSAVVDGHAVAANSVISIDRHWKAGVTTVSAAYTFAVTLEGAGYGDLFCVNRGPLLFALPIDAQKIEAAYTRGGVERKQPYHDEYFYPIGKWQYAFADTAFSVVRPEKTDASAYVFAKENAPLVIRARMIPIDWGYEPDMTLVCAKTPHSTVPTGEAEELTLIPYGFTDLRMTAMPRL